jgi:hypothetical protein
MPATTCEHMFDTTSRYETATKLLTFLLVCPVCRSEQVVETLEYEPNFVQRPMDLTRSPLAGVS